MNKIAIAKQQSDFILYTSNEGNVNIEVFLQDETIWLTQKAISELYGVQRPAITKHLKNIFDSGELQEDSVSSILEHTASNVQKLHFSHSDKPTKFQKDSTTRKIRSVQMESKRQMTKKRITEGKDGK